MDTITITFKLWEFALYSFFAGMIGAIGYVVFDKILNKTNEKKH